MSQAYTLSFIRIIRVGIVCCDYHLGLNLGTRSHINLTPRSHTTIIKHFHSFLQNTNFENPITNKHFRQTVLNLFWFITRVPSWTWKTWRFKFYLSRSRNSLEFVLTGEKIWTKKRRKLAENLDKNLEF